MTEAAASLDEAEISDLQPELNNTLSSTKVVVVGACPECVCFMLSPRLVAARSNKELPQGAKVTEAAASLDKAEISGKVFANHAAADRAVQRAEALAATRDSSSPTSPTAPTPAPDRSRRC